MLMQPTTLKGVEHYRIQVGFKPGLKALNCEGSVNGGGAAAAKS